MLFAVKAQGMSHTTNNIFSHNLKFFSHTQLKFFSHTTKFFVRELNILKLLIF